MMSNVSRVVARKCRASSIRLLVHMDDVDVQARELWAQMFRYEGDACVRGAFRLRPAKRLWVGPAELSMNGGKLDTGPHDVLHDMEGTLTVQ